MPMDNKTKGPKGNGSIRKYKDRWQGRYTVGHDPITGRQIQRSVYGKTQREVAQKLKALTLEVDNGTYTAPCAMTVSEWFDMWKSEYLGGIKESSAFLYKSNIKLYIDPHLGKMRLEALKPIHIQRFYNDLQHPKDDNIKALAPKTIKNVHLVLNSGLKQAKANGYLKTNPAADCVLPKAEKTEIYPLDDDLISTFLHEIKGHKHEYLYAIALFTGMRQGEILGLPWDCVDLDAGTLTVKQQLAKQRQKGGQYYISSPKTSKPRSFSLAPSVVGLFRKQKEKQEALRIEAGDLWSNEQNLVFTNEIGGYLSYRTVYDCFKRIMARIGSPTTRFHDLRHTFAVICLENGVDMKTIQEMLGHYSEAFTADVYAHVTEKMKKKGADLLEGAYQALSQSENP